MNDEMRDSGEEQLLTEEQMRAAFEEQMRHIRVEDVILQTVATLVNLGAQRLGLTGETDIERDLEQVRLSIEGARALAPLCPEEHQDAIRQALSQLQMAYAREVKPGQGAEPADAAPASGAPEAGPGQGSQAGDEAERAKARAKIWTPPGT